MRSRSACRLPSTSSARVASSAALLFASSARARRSCRRTQCTSSANVEKPEYAPLSSVSWVRLLNRQTIGHSSTRWAAAHSTDALQREHRRQLHHHEREQHALEADQPGERHREHAEGLPGEHRHVDALGQPRAKRPHPHQRAVAKPGQQPQARPAVETRGADERPDGERDAAHQRLDAAEYRAAVAGREPVSASQAPLGLSFVAHRLPENILAEWAACDFRHMFVWRAPSTLGA